MITKLFCSQRSSLLYCLEDISEQILRGGGEYDFYILSIHPDFDYRDVNPLIKKTLSNNYVAFHSTNAFYNDKIISKAVTCLAIKFERSGKISTFYVDDIINDKSALKKTVNYLNSNPQAFHIVLAGLAEDKFVFFLEEVSSKINYAPVNNIIGGISSGIEKEGELLTYQFVDDKVIKKGFVIVSFENVEAIMDISLGFIPYGITYEITKARNREIFTVDNGKNFRNLVDNLLEGIENPDVRYLWYLPINILDERDGYVATLRTPVKLKENSVEFFGPVKRGQKFKLSFATPDELIGEDIKCAKNIKNKLNHVELAFNFSCIARQYVLEDRQEDEIKNYASILDSHLFGFFTFGEIGPDKQFKKLKLYNETSLVVGMREK